MNNAAALYFVDKFDQTKEAAGAIASIFGWLNIFARGMGGYFSDDANRRYGMKGRLWIHTIFLVAEGALVLLFATTNSLGMSILVLVLFSLCVQAAEGTSYGIVPYIDPLNMGSVCGIVGAGGNVGAVAFGLGFRQLHYSNAFKIMGASILFSSLLSFFIHIKGYSGMIVGKELSVDPETGEVKDRNTDEEVEKMISNSNQI